MVDVALSLCDGRRAGRGSAPSPATASCRAATAATLTNLRRFPLPTESGELDADRRRRLRPDLPRRPAGRRLARRDRLDAAGHAGALEVARSWRRSAASWPSSSGSGTSTASAWRPTSPTASRSSRPPGGSPPAPARSSRSSRTASGVRVFLRTPGAHELDIARGRPRRSTAPAPAPTCAAQAPPLLAGPARRRRAPAPTSSASASTSTRTARCSTPTARASERLFAIGALRKGVEWEAIGITEIRDHSGAVARQIVPHRRNRGRARCRPSRGADASVPAA